MRLAERVHLVASGQLGVGLTDDHDCHVYLLDGGAEYALVDAGGGRDTGGSWGRSPATASIRRGSGRCC